jgi:predicted transcriptional regulator
MIVREMLGVLQAEVIAGAANIDNDISGGYASDLLSNVMSQANSGNIWITMHAHQNVIAVASLLGLSAVIIAGDVQPDKEAVSKADAEQIPLLMTSLPVFEVVGLLYSKGVKGV